MGLTFTTIYRGDNKNNGTQHEPLSEESLGMFQGMIDEMYETFTGSVAEYRGLKQQAIIDTQAGLYFGPGAVSAGLADEVSDPRRRSMLSRQSISNPVKKPPFRCRQPRWTCKPKCNPAQTQTASP